MKFHDCKPAPSSRLVRMFIAEKGIEVERVEVDLRAGEHLTPPFMQLNPYCTVPVLETGDGLVLTSTQGCWRYLEAAFPAPSLLGVTAREQGLIADRIWRIDLDGFHALAEAARNSMPGFRNRALTGPVSYAQIPDLADRGVMRARRFLETFEAYILGDNEYVGGDKFSAADIMAFVTVEFSSWIKLGLPPEATRAHEWLARIKARPSAAL